VNVLPAGEREQEGGDAADQEADDGDDGVEFEELGVRQTGRPVVSQAKPPRLSERAASILFIKTVGRDRREDPSTPWQV
jgi:hypothetical protein